MAESRTRSHRARRLRAAGAALGGAGGWRLAAARSGSSAASISSSCPAIRRSACACRSLRCPSCRRPTNPFWCRPIPSPSAACCPIRRCWRGVLPSPVTVTCRRQAARPEAGWRKTPKYPCARRWRSNRATASFACSCRRSNGSTITSSCWPRSRRPPPSTVCRFMSKAICRRIDPRLNVIKVTPDPGVIEVNVHPVGSWRDAVGVTQTLYEEARLTRLGADKFIIDGRHTGTGGGNHVVLGGESAADSPFLRRPDLLEELRALFPAPPFAVLSVLRPVHRPDQPGAAHRRGAPRPALRAGHRRCAWCRRPARASRRGRGWSTGCSAISWSTSPAIPTAPKSASTNCSRPTGRPGRLGLVEFRSFEMPPDARMSLAQQLLLRALVAWFWRVPQRGRLVRWGTALHDRFMLEHFVWADFLDVLDDLRGAGFPFAVGVVRRAARIPLLLLRQGRAWRRRDWKSARRSSPGMCSARRPPAAAPRALSIPRCERLQVKVQGFNPERHLVACNGRRVPLCATGRSGEYVAGVRFKAWPLASSLQPTAPVQTLAHLRHL